MTTNSGKTSALSLFGDFILACMIGERFDPPRQGHTHIYLSQLEETVRHIPLDLLDPLPRNAMCYRRFETVCKGTTALYDYVPNTQSGARALASVDTFMKALEQRTGQYYFALNENAVQQLWHACQTIKKDAHDVLRQQEILQEVKRQGFGNVISLRPWQYVSPPSRKAPMPSVETLEMLIQFTDAFRENFKQEKQPKNPAYPRPHFLG